MSNPAADFIAGYRAAAQQLVESVAFAIGDFAGEVEVLMRDYRASQAAEAVPALAPAGADTGHAAGRSPIGLSDDLDVSSHPPEGPGAPDGHSATPAATVPPASSSEGVGDARRVIVTDRETIRQWAGVRGLIMDTFDLNAVNAKADHLGLPRFALERQRR